MEENYYVSQESKDLLKIYEDLRISLYFFKHNFNYEKIIN